MSYTDFTFKMKIFLSKKDTSVLINTLLKGNKRQK